MKEMVGLMASKEAEPMDVIALVVSILGFVTWQMKSMLGEDNG